MIRIKILRGTIAGKEPRNAGDIIEVNDYEARQLILMRKAIVAEKQEMKASRGRPKKSE